MTLDNYHKFTRQLVLTTACTVLLSKAVSDLIQNVVSVAAPYFPAWPFSLLQIILASLGLWWLTKNGKKSKALKEKGV